MCTQKALSALTAKHLFLHCNRNFDPIHYLVNCPAFSAFRQPLKQLLTPAQHNLTDTEKSAIIICKVTATPHIIIPLFKKNPLIWQKPNNTQLIFGKSSTPGPELYKFIFINRSSTEKESTIKAVPNKRQPGDTPRSRIFVIYIQMAKTRNIPYSTCVKMQVLHEEGCSYRQITTRCGCRHTTARMIIRRFQQSGSLKDKPRSGRSRCSTARDDRVMLRLCRIDRKKTAPELRRQWSEKSRVQCTTRTVRGRILKHGFKSCVARRKSH